MDREIPIVPSLAFISALVAALFTHLFFLEDFEINGPGQLTEDPNGKLWVIANSHLVSLAENNTVPLVINELQTQHGEVAFISSHQVLTASYYRGQPSQFSYCSLIQPFNCENANFEYSPDSYVHVQTLEDNQGFLISDNRQNNLVWLDSTGSVKDSLPGFKYANGIEYINGKLWFANSNSHELIRLELSQGNLQIAEKISIAHPLLEEQNHTYPYEFTFWKNRIWVVMGDVFRTDVGLYEFDLEWDLIKRVKLPEDAFINDVFGHESGLIASDRDNLKVFQLVEGVDVWAEIENKELTALRNQELQRYQSTKVAALAAYTVIVVIALVALGWIVKGSKSISMENGNQHLANRYRKAAIDISNLKQSKKSNDSQELKNRLAELRGDTNSIFIKRSKEYHSHVRSFAMLGFGFLLIAFAMPLVFPRSSSLLEDPFVLVMAAISVFVFVALFVFLKSISQIAVKKGVLYIRDGKSDKVYRSDRVKDFFYNETQIYMDGYITMYQGHRTPLFEKEQFNEYALPILTEAQYKSPASLLWFRLKDRQMGAWMHVFIFMATFAFATWNAFYRD